MNKYFLLTTDVETTSIINHRLSDETGKKVADEAIPKLLDFYEKHGVKSTFFITGYFAEKFPYAVKQIHQAGHEIGCHGYSHKYKDFFANLSLSEQIEHLSRSKTILEKIIHDDVISFRAPALITNKETVSALEQTGFKIDSSVASQRFDFFFSLGSKEKMQWLKAPRLPYHTGKFSLSKKGNSDILEIPISAFIMPYIGTTMRIFPLFIKVLRNYLATEAIRKGNPVNLLIHPNEMIIEKKIDDKIQRRTKSIISYFISDIIRHKLKLKNLGEPCYQLLEEQIQFFKNKQFEFITCKDYLERNKNE